MGKHGPLTDDYSYNKGFKTGIAAGRRLERRALWRVVKSLEAPWVETALFPKLATKPAKRKEG